MEDGRPKTEDGRRKTEDRRPKTKEETHIAHRIPHNILKNTRIFIVKRYPGYRFTTNILPETICF